MVLILVGYGVMLGLISRKKLKSILLRLILGPIVMLILWGMAASIWNQLSLFEQVAAVGIIFFALALYVFVGTRFGREVLAAFCGHLLHDFFAGLYSLIRGIFVLIARLVRKIMPGKRKTP